jgi:RND family efflux transporter MFP subunit
MSDANDLLLDAEERKLFEERARRLRADDVPSWEELEARMAEPAPRSSTSVGIAAIVAVAATLALAWSLSRARPPAPAPAPAPAAVAPAPPSAARVPADAVPPSGPSGVAHLAAGYVTATEPISVSAPSSGVIRDLRVKNGDAIAKGQLLVVLDFSRTRDELIAAQAELRSAEAQYATKSKLMKVGAATPAEVAKARVEVELASARLAPIMARSSQSRITSPIDGIVLERLAQPGETVAAGSPIMKIADLKRLAVEVDIVEADLPKIHIGQAVKVTSDAVVDRSYDGKVSEIAAYTDEERGTVLVKVELRVRDTALRPGNSARCAFLPTVPSRAPAYAEPRDEPGYLVANTQPWSRVLIDDKDTGQSTPIPPRRRLRLAPGQRKITFVVDRKRFDYFVDVRPGEEIRLIKQLQRPD